MLRVNVLYSNMPRDEGAGFVLQRKRRCFVRYIAWWERNAEGTTGTRHGKARGKKDAFWNIKS